MNNVIGMLKNEARELAASHGVQGLTPGLAGRLKSELAFCRETFFDHPLLLRLREDVLPFLYDDTGFGVDHSKKVAIEAGALVLAEEPGWTVDRTRRLALLAMLAGLLHDVCRLEDGHALKGAEVAMTILQGYPLSDRDRDLIFLAIASHEDPAHSGEPRFADDEEARLVAAALHDADKFRWGPDLFVTTLWETCDYEDWSVADVARRLPAGLNQAAARVSGFRTRIGQTHGPALIETGLALGRQIHARLLERLTPLTSGCVGG